MERTQPQPFNLAIEFDAIPGRSAHAAGVRRDFSRGPEENFQVRIGTTVPHHEQLTQNDFFAFENCWSSKTDTYVSTEESALAFLRGKVSDDIFAQLVAKIGRVRDVVWHVVADESEGGRAKAATLVRLEDGSFDLAAGYIHESDRHLPDDVFMRGKRYQEKRTFHAVDNIADVLRILTDLDMRDLALKMFVMKWR